MKYLKDEALDKQSRSDSRSTPPASDPTHGLFPSKLGKQISESDVKRNMLLYIVRIKLVIIHHIKFLLISWVFIIFEV
ncbi:unnamed protein product [Trichobilharzia regenti]|nr:unnamed protein product [Trichobilharzia regenti]